MTDDRTDQDVTAPGAAGQAPAGPGRPQGARKPAVDVAGLAAAVRSIERGENPAAPAPRGDPAEARRKRREAMAAEVAALQAAEAAEAAGAGMAGTAEAADAADAETAAAPAEDSGDEPVLAAEDSRAGLDTEGGPALPADEAADDTAGAGPAAAHERPRRAGDDTPAGDAGVPARPALDPAAVEAARLLLAEGHAPETLARAAVEAFGERADETLREDPWQVLALPGVRVEHADGFARALLGADCAPDDPRRLVAIVVWLLDRASEHGHTALESSVLCPALEKQAVPDPEAALAAAVTDGRVLVFRDAEGAVAGRGTPAGAGADDEAEDDRPVRMLFGLDRYALAEESLADGLGRLLNTFEPDELDWEAAASAAPSPSAAELIRAASTAGLVVHTGCEAARDEPAALVTAAAALGLHAYAAAYTEDGRRRLATRVGAERAVTVAGLLSGHEGPGRRPDGSLALDVLAVLDAPQLDAELAATLVEAVPDGARLVLSGDPGVLWSAGPGRVFADLLAARCCTQVASRTPDPGPIGELVSGIGAGELTSVEAPAKEVVIVPVRDPREAVHRTVQLVADSVPRVIGVPPEQTQVITPGHGGAAGTRVLNAALKERLNPGPGRFGGFDPGDRVVYAPEPGRTLPGVVAGAEPDGLRLDSAVGSVLVPRDRLEASVRHGWAMTAHQASGLRWPAVVVVVPGDATSALTRSWVYTAFGRGERHLSVVQGAAQALAQVVAEVPAKDRTTRLRTVLREQTGTV